MRYYKQLVIHVGISSAVLILITAILTGIQVNNSNNTLVSILNNIIICFLTGGIILFFQAIIGYKNAKRECLLAYYKDLILLEDKIIHYPFSGIGFIEASKGLKDIRDITTLFDAGAKFTYMQIDFGERKDCVLEAAQMLFKSYAKHIKAYKEFDSDICDALRDAETSSQTEIEQINKKLQDKAKEIESIFNDREEQKIRVAAYETLENYLFKGKTKKSGLQLMNIGNYLFKKKVKK